MASAYIALMVIKCLFNLITNHGKLSNIFTDTVFIQRPKRYASKQIALNLTRLAIINMNETKTTNLGNGTL